MVTSTHLVRDICERELIERYRRVHAKPAVGNPSLTREDKGFIVPSSSNDLKAAIDGTAAQGRIDIYA